MQAAMHLRRCDLVIDFRGHRPAGGAGVGGGAGGGPGGGAGPPPAGPPPRSGRYQLARSPRSDTSSPPSTATSTWPPRIMANEAALSKKLAPGSSVIGWPPALIRS